MELTINIGLPTMCGLILIFFKVANEDFSNTINVTNVMHTWIKQMGYPVVNIEYNSVTGQVILTQKHFLLDPAKIDQRPASLFGYFPGFSLIIINAISSSFHLI